MDPNTQAVINTLCMIAIAVFVGLAYFNGWG